MAFYEDDEENPQDPNAQGAATQAPSGSQVISGGGSGAEAPKAAGAPDKPGNFVGLKDYLNANQSQSQKLGDQTAGVVNSAADSARQGIASLNQEAQDKIKGTSALNDDVRNKISSGAEALSGDERNLVKSTEAAKYQGPADVFGLSGYQGASQASQAAKQKMDMTNTEEGRMGLVSQINDKPRTQGINTFDNALLQAGGGREKLSNVVNANKGLGDEFSNTANAITGQAQGAKTQTEAAAGDATKRVQDALSSWQQGFQPKVTAAQQNLIDMQNRVTGDIGDNPYGLSEETMGLLGLDPNTRVYGTDLNQYLNAASPTDINAENVASGEDYARYGALADLSGTAPSILNPANAAKAGTAPKLTANTAQLQSDIKAADQKFEKEYNTKNVSLDTHFQPPLSTGAGQIFSDFAQGHTPAYIENIVVPDLQKRSGAGYQNAATALQAALEAWKKSQGYRNVVNSTEPAALPQNDNGSIDWGSIQAPGGK